jgi:RHS repeat-associated protein
VEVVSAQDYYPFGMVMPEREYYTERYRFGFGGHEKDSEIKGEGNSVDMGARMLDTRIGRTGSLDPKMGLYPGISPYAYALNTPVNAIDPDGKLVIFVNGYRPCLPGVNVYREVKRDDKVFRGDKFGYWGGVDGQFMNKIGDHNAVYADGDAPTLTAKSQFGFNARMAHGRQAAQDLISKINSGEVVLKKNDKGEVVESIKVVSHSMGYAYSLGMIKELEKAGYKVEVSYNLAPENPKGGDIPNNVVRSVQYGSGPKDPWYNQDRIAPQSEINNVDEIAPIPDKNTAGENIPKGPYDSHAVSNYGKWIFGLNKDQQGYVAPRQDTQAADPK